MSISEILNKGGIKLFTIGFTKKSASDFFNILKTAGVKRVVDVRLSNVSQLAGFTKRADLEFFLNTIAKIEYIHRPDMAPTKEMLDGYKKGHLSWPEYENKFTRLMTERSIEHFFKLPELDHACLLCSEPKPDKCHRQLVAEYFKAKMNNVDIHHL